MYKLTDKCKTDLKIKFKELINTTLDNGIYSQQSDIKAKEFFTIIIIDIGRVLTEKEMTTIFSNYKTIVKDIVCSETIELQNDIFDYWFNVIEGVING